MPALTAPTPATPAPALVLRLDIAEATPSNNTIKGMHYRVYQKCRQDWQARVLEAAGGALPAAPLRRCFLHIERHSSGAGLDWDNAYGGLKPLLDCLVSGSDRNPDGLGIIFDDSPAFMPYAPEIVQRKAAPGHGRTIVSIYDLGALSRAPLSWVN